MAQLARAIQSGQFHQGRKQQRQQRRPLGSLSLGETNFRIQDLDIVLGALQCGLKELALDSTNFDKDSWKLIKDRYPGYLSTITVLDLNDCALLNESQVHDILCSVTSLEVFRANFLRGSNLERDRRSWVCLSLKELSLGFVRRTRRGQCLFLNQLSRLPRLGILGLSQYIAESQLDEEDEDEKKQEVGKEGVIDTAEPPDPPSANATSVNFGCQTNLSLTLAMGLDRLKTLRGLRRLEAPRRHLGSDKTYCKTCVWSEAEARWVVDNWVNLEELFHVRMTRGARDILRKQVSLSFCDLID